MTIDFKQIKEIKRLGSGMFGTSFLVKYNGNNYCLKREKILTKKNKKGKIIPIINKNELYFYKFLKKTDKISKIDKSFFIKYYGNRIVNKCKFVNKQPFKVDKKGNPRFYNMLKDRKKSKYCYELLIEYIDGITLADFLPKYGMQNSFILQLVKIIYTLYLNGFSHNDSHARNIMVRKTDEKYFKLMGTDVEFGGYQLVLIDYGEVLIRKEKTDKFDKSKIMNHTDFYLYEKDYCYMQIMYNVWNILYSVDKLKQCELKKIPPPWFKIKGKLRGIDNWLINVISKHNDFYTLYRNKYFKLYPEAKKNITKLENDVELYLNDKEMQKINDDIFDKYMIIDWDKIHTIKDAKKQIKNRMNIFLVIDKIFIAFNLFHPKEFSKYFGWCSYEESLIDPKIIVKILDYKDPKDVIKYLLSVKSFV